MPRLAPGPPRESGPRAMGPAWAEGQGRPRCPRLLRQVAKPGSKEKFPPFAELSLVSGWGFGATDSPPTPLAFSSRGYALLLGRVLGLELRARETSRTIPCVLCLRFIILFGPRRNPGKNGASIPSLARKEPRLAEVKCPLRPWSGPAGLHIPPCPAKVKGQEETGPPRVNCLKGFLEKNNDSLGKRTLRRDSSLW